MKEIARGLICATVHSSQLKQLNFSMSASGSNNTSSTLASTSSYTSLTAKNVSISEPRRANLPPSQAPTVVENHKSATTPGALRARRKAPRNTPYSIVFPSDAFQMGTFTELAVHCNVCRFFPGEREEVKSLTVSTAIFYSQSTPGSPGCH